MWYISQHIVHLTSAFAAEMDSHWVTVDKESACSWACGMCRWVEERILKEKIFIFSSFKIKIVLVGWGLGYLPFPLSILGSDWNVSILEVKVGPDFRPKVLICIIENGVENHLCLSARSWIYVADKKKDWFMVGSFLEKNLINPLAGMIWNRLIIFFS